MNLSLVKTEPWTDPLSPWKTRSAFFVFLRGQLRRCWTHYPIKNTLKNGLSRPNNGELPARVKQVVDCNRCGAIVAKSHAEVDHITSAGSLSSWEDVPGFVERLFTTSGNMRLLCKSCHKTVTLAERFKCSEDEVRKFEAVTAFRKLGSTEQSRLLSSLGITLSRNNQAARLQAYANHVHCNDTSPGGC